MTPKRCAGCRVPTLDPTPSWILAGAGIEERAMYQWSDEMQMVRDAVRDFVDREIRPHRDELEHGDLPPYDLLRKLYATFGMDAMAAASFDARITREKAAAGAPAGDEEASDGDGEGRRSNAGMTMLPIIELCKCSPGMVTALGVSVGLTSAAIMARGTIRQKERWARDLLTLDTIGAWAITEPDSGSDAFGSMKSTARRDGDEYVLNGQKTFITNGPYADTIVFICKLDEGNPPADRKILHFVLERGMPGLEQSKPLRKMGLHSSPTGMLFVDDVRVGIEHLLGETEDIPASAGREASKVTFSMERSGVAAMALGIIERCLELCVPYAKERVQFGRPIGEFQLIQLKLAKMEVARLNVENLVFRALEKSADGVGMDLAEASAMKLYSAQAATDVALEAVQLFGGNGYMAEYEVEQLARDAKVLQIYAGTDEIQVGQIARSLLA
jgi:alkylation response protein AidB-like acyl-CoA dehydrogenase